MKSIGLPFLDMQYRFHSQFSVPTCTTQRYNRPLSASFPSIPSFLSGASYHYVMRP